MSRLVELLESVEIQTPRGAGFPHRFVPRGEVLFQQDEPGDCLYLVRSGRIRAIYGYGTARERVLGEVGRGECIGEMALLTRGTRGATAVAIRDSELIQVRQIDAEQLGAQYPRALLEIMRIIAERLHRSNQALTALPERLTLAVLPAERTAPLAWLCEALLSSLPGEHRPAMIRSGDLPADLLEAARHETPNGDVRLTRWLNDKEQEANLLILQGDSDAGAWNRQCARQADIILCVADARSIPEPELIESALESLRGSAARPRIETVLVHSAFPCRETGRWLVRPTVSRHHHVRLRTTPDVQRMARILTGRDLTVVLGGGGARGFAQIGVLKAAEELGLSIDRVGGTSMGAVIGGHYALHQNWRQTREDLRREFVEKGRLNDYTLPFQSMIVGRRYERLLQNLFGEARIEDLPLSFFCMSCNLTCAASVAHREGPAWKWLSASISIPGMAPPLVDEGELYIDGGILNNLPVDVAREEGTGYILAVDVSPEVDLKLNGSFQGRPGAWQVLRTWMTGRREGRFPSLFDVLLRTTELSSISNKNSVTSLADCYLRLPVQRFKMFEWNEIDRLIELGYQNALQTLSQFQEKIRPEGLLRPAPA